MATVNKWAGVAIAMQSVLGAAKTITAIAKSTTCTVTATHDFAAGDYVVLDVTGMQELDNRMFRVLSVSTTVSFVLEGIDSTLFGTFGTGTANKLTLGTALGTVLTLTSSGGDYSTIDTTTIHDKIKQSIPGIPTGLEMSFENIWDPADAGLLAMKVAADATATRGFLFTFATGAKMCLNGYVGATLVPTGSAQDKVQTAAKIMATGLPCYFSS